MRSGPRNVSSVLMDGSEGTLCGKDACKDANKLRALWRIKMRVFKLKEATVERSSFTCTRSTSNHVEIFCAARLRGAGAILDHSRCKGVPLSKVQEDIETSGYLQGGLRINGIQAYVEIVGLSFVIRFSRVSSTPLARTKVRG